MNSKKTIKSTRFILLGFIILNLSMLFAIPELPAGVTLENVKQQLENSSVDQLKQSMDAINQNSIEDIKPVIKKVDNKADKSTSEAKKPIEKKVIEDVKSSIETKFPNNLKQFGYDIFTTSTLNFTPIQNIPVGSDYIIGPGDELNIYIWGNIQQSLVQKVENDGTIILPKSGKLFVSNMSLSTAKRVINNILATNFTNFTLDLTVSRLKTIDVFVLGEAVMPGRYNLNSFSTLLYAIYFAGGPTKIGTLRNIQLIRDKRLYKIIDLYDLLLKGDKSGDISLKSGDTVFIPKIGNVAAIQGEVKVPAIYEIEDKSSLYTLVSLAGMYTRNTYIKEINLITRSADDRFVLKTLRYKSFDDFVNGSKGAIIDNGDIIEIKAISNEIDDWIKITGEVTFPGMYEYTKAKNMLELTKLAGGFFKTAYLERAEIVRIASNNNKLLIPIDLRTDLSKISLNKFDEVTIYNNTKVYKNENVKIQGEVYEPGSFPYLLKMTLKDLIFKSGGLNKNAYLDKAEIVRVAPNNSKDIITVNLKSDLSKIMLNELDEVTVYSISKVYKSEPIKIQGEVYEPGSFPYLLEMTLKDLIFKSGGFTIQADKHYISILSNNSPSENKVAVVDFENASDFMLNPNDEVFVRKIPSYNSLGKVEIKGNVMYPGIYPLFENETLSLLFIRAGGITGKAYKNGIVLNRPVTGNEILDSLKDKTGTGSTGDVVQNIARLSNFDRIRIDFDKIFMQNNCEENIVLLNGDIIDVPNIPVDVKIVGGVYNQGTFLYKQYTNLGKYLEMAGMFRKDADMDEIHVVHADGTVTKTNNFGFSIERGDTIIVPTKQLEKIDIVKTILDWSQVIFNLAAVWKVVFQH